MPSSTSECQVRRHWTISYANASVRRLISGRLAWKWHFYFLFIICFSHLTMLYWQYNNTPDAFPMLHGYYSMVFLFTQNPLNKYVRFMYHFNSLHVNQYSTHNQESTQLCTVAGCCTLTSHMDYEICKNE